MVVPLTIQYHPIIAITIRETNQLLGYTMHGQSKFFHVGSTRCPCNEFLLSDSSESSTMPTQAFHMRQNRHWKRHHFPQIPDIPRAVLLISWESSGARSEVPMRTHLCFWMKDMTDGWLPRPGESLGAKNWRNPMNPMSLRSLMGILPKGLPAFVVWAYWKATINHHLAFWILDSCFERWPGAILVGYCHIAWASNSIFFKKTLAGGIAPNPSWHASSAHRKVEPINDTYLVWTLQSIYHHSWWPCPSINTLNNIATLLNYR